ncbi:MAG: DUF917 domain-containing protein [Conexivisphaerales archaeon]
MHIGLKEVDELAFGSAILGTGGGGDPYIGSLMLKKAIADKGPVELIDPKHVERDSLVLPVAMMGAPVVMIEKLPGGSEVVRALKAYETIYEEHVDYISTIEIGGINSTIPLMVAAKTRLPLPDGDGMGRAFPELQMVSFHLKGINASPVIMFDERGNLNIVNSVDDFWAEKIARAVTGRFGGSAYIALYKMRGAQYKNSLVRGSVSKAIEIGRRLLDKRKSGKNVLDELLDLTKGYELFRGKIVDVNRRIEKGFARGTVSFQGLDSYQQRQMQIDFQNENLVARVDNHYLATVPDLIVILDIETFKPITTERLRFGFRAIVIGMPCEKIWRTKQGLKVAGPRYFGYDVDYIPIEKRAAYEN